MVKREISAAWLVGTETALLSTVDNGTVVLFLSFFFCLFFNSSFFVARKTHDTPLFGTPKSWYVANITPACRQLRLETRNQLFAERPRWPAYTSVLLICCFCCSAESEQCVPDPFTCLPRSYNSCNLNPTLRRGVAHRSRACAEMFGVCVPSLCSA